MASLYYFVDGFFANNKNLNSQIGFVIVYGNEKAADYEKSFQITGNILYWFSVKCKRVTRNVFANEIYGIVSGFDIGYVLKKAFYSIIKRFN